MADRFSTLMAQGQDEMARHYYSLAHGSFAKAAKANRDSAEAEYQCALAGFRSSCEDFVKALHEKNVDLRKILPPGTPIEHGLYAAVRDDIRRAYRGPSAGFDYYQIARNETLTRLRIRKVREHVDRAMQLRPDWGEPQALARQLDQVTAKTKEKGCYIATACYGSYCHPDVLTLRQYRDMRLSKSSPGRSVIRLYYWASPPLARWLGGHKGLAEGIKKVLLQPLVCRLRRRYSTCATVDEKSV